MNSVTATATSPLLQVGLLRRTIPAELIELRQVIATSGLHDEMTRNITLWQENFAKALKSSADEEEVCSFYIRELQTMLVDPATLVPLDLYAVLGSDGYTYGQMSLAVYLLSMPAEYQRCSPMNPENPARFWVAPHLVVRHALGWLQQHDALLYSAELEQRYLQLLPQQRPLDTQTKVARVAARQAIQAKRRDQEIKDLERELEERLSLMAVKDQEDMTRLQTKLDRMAEPFQAVQIQLKEAQQEEEQYLSGLKNRIEEQMRTNLQPLAHRIDTFAKKSTAELQKVADADQKMMRQLEGEIHGLQREIDDLTKCNEELKASLNDTSLQLNAAKREETALQQAICETKIAVREMKKQSSTQLLKSIVLVGGCFFGTWAMTSFLQYTSIGASLTPVQNGAMFSIRIFLK